MVICKSIFGTTGADMQCWRLLPCRYFPLNALELWFAYCFMVGDSRSRADASLWRISSVPESAFD